MSTANLKINRKNKAEELSSVYDSLKKIKYACKKNPGMNNLIGWELEWLKYPELFDILDKHSEQYYLKLLEKEIYMYYIKPVLKYLPVKARILDAGSGVGRFAVELGGMGYKMSLVDVSETSLKKASKHLSEKGISGASFYLGSIENMKSLFRDDTFDAIFSIEAACYTTNPLKSLKELVRTTKKGGFLFVSMEGLYGAVLSDNSIGTDKIKDVIRTSTMSIEQNLFARYYTKKTFMSLLGKSGAEVIKVEGTHYIPEGPFSRLIDTQKLKSASYRREILKLEKWCSTLPAYHELARSWLGILRK